MVSRSLLRHVIIDHILSYFPRLHIMYEYKRPVLGCLAVDTATWLRQHDTQEYVHTFSIVMNSLHFNELSVTTKKISLK